MEKHSRGLVCQGLRCPYFAFADSLDFSLSEKSITAVMGPSGCGKSSLLRILAGGMTPTSGRCYLFGKRIFHVGQQPDLLGSNLPGFKRDIAIAPQNDVLFQGFGVLNQLRLAQFLGTRRRRHSFSMHEVTEGLDLSGFLKSSVEDLSGGQRARVSLARAILSSPRCLLVDEGLARVDPMLRERVFAFLREFVERTGGLVLLATHDIPLSKQCDAVLMLGNNMN